jgi:hypothetical protein
MRRALVLDDLDRAERQVVTGKKQITEQIEFIAWLAWFGRDATGAKALLRDFERGLARHIADRERLHAQLTYLNEIEASRQRQTRHKSGVQEMPAFDHFDPQIGAALAEV